MILIHCSPSNYISLVLPHYLIPGVLILDPMFIWSVSQFIKEPAIEPMTSQRSTTEQSEASNMFDQIRLKYIEWKPGRSSTWPQGWSLLIWPRDISTRRLNMVYNRYTTKNCIILYINLSKDMSDYHLLLLITYPPHIYSQEAIINDKYSFTSIIQQVMLIFVYKKTNKQWKQ